jgi:hypothetical protein
VSAVSRLNFLYLAYASKPKAERLLYRAVRRRRISRIVEFGMTSLLRSRRLIEVAQRYAPPRTVCFTGVDPFEAAAVHGAAGTAPRQTLIDVFRALRPTGASVRLLPGTLAGVLPDAANTLPGTDLLLMATTVSEADMAEAWFYLPRMLHAGSLVLWERASPGSEVTFEPVPLAQIQSLAARRHRAAA